VTELIRTKFDLVVIGTGAAATTVASKCASAGWKVAITAMRPIRHQPTEKLPGSKRCSQRKVSIV
jgi:glycerol-3-phosphate dehydrogenase